MSATGWAVSVDGVIYVKTVSTTRRAAIVNWLGLNGRMVYNYFSDAKIEMMWTHEVTAAANADRGTTVTVVEVTIDITKARGK